jgi:transcription initiation factor TFIIE subunit alpha
MVRKPKIPHERIVLLNEVIKRIAGKNTGEIGQILLAKDNVNEFKIAEKLGLTINQARNILYKLHAHDIVSFTRKKDKRKGWYIYFWTLDQLKSLHSLKKIKLKETEELTRILTNRQQKRFFICHEDNIELNEESAMHHEFLCPECGKLLELADNQKKIREIKNRIDYIKREIEKISIQIEIVTPKPRPIKKKKRKIKKKVKKKVKKVKKKTKPKKIKPKKIKKKKPKKKKTKKNKVKKKKIKPKKKKKKKPKKKIKKRTSKKKKGKKKSKKKIKKKGKKKKPKKKTKKKKKKK